MIEAPILEREDARDAPAEDLGEEAGGHADAAERRCLATGAVRPKAELIRFVVSPEGLVVPDLAERLPGRGLWVSAERSALDQAIAKKLFARAARRQVELPGDLAEQVERLLRRRCLDRLSLAKRAGAVVAGHDKVRAWLEAGRAALLLQAADGSPDERGRLVRLGQGVKPSLKVVTAFAAAEIGAALGREQAVHVALASGGLAAALDKDLLRFLAVQKGQEDARG